MALGWDMVAGAHSGGRYFLGEQPYVCDIYFANLSRWWKMRERLRARHPAFCDAMERVDSLPEVAPVWQRHWS
jgi:GST-like protein